MIETVVEYRGTVLAPKSVAVLPTSAKSEAKRRHLPFLCGPRFRLKIAKKAWYRGRVPVLSYQREGRPFCAHSRRAFLSTWVAGSVPFDRVEVNVLTDCREVTLFDQNALSISCTGSMQSQEPLGRHKVGPPVAQTKDSFSSALLAFLLSSSAPSFAKPARQFGFLF